MKTGGNLRFGLRMMWEGFVRVLCEEHQLTYTCLQ